MDHFLQHPWYYFKEYEIMQLISGLLSVALTVFAMWWIDKRAAKRWTQEGYLKRKVELEIMLINELSGLKKTLNTERDKKEKISEYIDEYISLSQNMNVNQLLKDFQVVYCGFYPKIDFENWSNVEIYANNAPDILAEESNKRDLIKKIIDQAINTIRYNIPK